MKIALTGGVGSGKSLVSDIIIELGYDVINADKLAKEILLTDESVKSKIIKEFGKESYNAEGINTKYIAEKVFVNPNNVKKINSFVHPPTIKKIEALAAEILKAKKMVFVESALVYEANLEDLFDYILLVTADDNLRIKRVIERDKVSEEEVKVRMENQIAEKEKRSLADFVIENNSSIEDLKNKVKFFTTVFESIKPQ
ncbi:MAG: dephospho-CoA kinase [Ignavibacteria bacterium GWB2_35_6b]|nr:MAG: dephospho-CoA kinase [Ignavibacteria bacterium GWB2_35_6b]